MGRFSWIEGESSLSRDFKGSYSRVANLEF
jgi:hypothetical protein